MQNLTINPQRLWDTLMETAQIGGTPKGGICRLTLTDLDRQVRAERGQGRFVPRPPMPPFAAAQRLWKTNTAPKAVER